jgi:hypothetical protein
LLGRKYNRLKNTHGGERVASGQNDHLKTAEKMAEQHGVSRATVERAGALVSALDKHNGSALSIEVFKSSF